MPPNDATLEPMMLRAGMLSFVAATLLAAGSAWGKARTDISLPIRFEPNVGQGALSDGYVARGPGYVIGVGARGATLRLGSKRDSHLALRLAGAARGTTPRAERPASSVSNYFVGSDRSKWRSSVANFGAVRIPNAYPGIDWLIYADARQLEYDLIVAPQADPRRIRLSIEGADTVELKPTGDLRISSGGQLLNHLKPVAYQRDDDGGRRSVAAHYVVKGRRVSFELGPYDHSRELVIDPVLAYSTYIGSSGNLPNPAAVGVATDGTPGNIYVTGTSYATDGSGENAFVAQFNAAGDLVYVTYLGAPASISTPGGIAVDVLGKNVYVAGTTNATSFPMLNPFQSTNHAASAAAGTNAFVARLDAGGGALLYSTYLGGSGEDGAAAIAVDGSGNAYVAGSATSRDYPTVNAFQASNHTTLEGDANAVISVLNADGSALLYSTYLGGSGARNASGDHAKGIALDGFGNAYVVGETCSTDFPVAHAFQSTYKITGPNNYYTAFVTELSPGGALVYSTYLGGSTLDVANAIDVDGTGIYVAGVTASADFPLVNPMQADIKVSAGNTTGFVTKFSPAGSALLYSTYLGGSLGASANAIVIGLNGLLVAGSTTSTDFPTVDPLQSTNAGAALKTSNAFVVEFSINGNELTFSTYLGGSGSATPPPGVAVPAIVPAPTYGDAAAGIAIDDAGNPIIVGTTQSQNFPTVNAAIGTNQTTGNSFLAKIQLPVVVGPPNPVPSAHGGGGAIGWDLILGLACLRAVTRRPFRRANSRPRNPIGSRRRCTAFP